MFRELMVRKVMLMGLVGLLLVLPTACDKSSSSGRASRGGSQETAPAGKAAPVDDMLALKEMNFSDEEIASELLPAEERFVASETDLQRLREAGFGEALLSRLSPARATATGMDNAALAEMAQRGEAVQAMLEAIATRGGTFDTSASAMLKLKEQGVPQVVLLAVRRQPVSAEDIRKLHADNVDEAAMLQLIDIVGAARPAVDVTQARELMDAGVPVAVIARLKQPAGPTVSLSSAGAMTDLMTSTPTDVPAESDAMIGSIPAPLPAATRSQSGGLSADGKTYTHPLGLYTLPIPGNWRVMRESTNGTAELAITPDRDAEKIEDLRVAVQIITFRLSEDSPVLGQDAQSMLDQLLPLLQQEHPDMKRVGEVEAVTLSGLPAGKQTLRGKLKDKPGEFRGEMYLLAGQDHQKVLVGLMAPTERFADVEPTFRQVLDGLRVTGFRGPPRKSTPYNTAELCEKYKASVVSITTPYGSGTGFIVSEDGYVVTNAHVILKDMAKGEPAEKVWVEWDSDLNLPKLEAKLVAWRFDTQHGKDSHRSLTLHGEDTALLKIPAVRRYTPAKITPLSMVRLGDPVVTMGFPTRTSFSSLSRVITEGVVSRFNKDANGVVRSIYMDAATTHGSSGGPCFSLATGGVIGQSTFGVDAEFAQMWGFRHKNLANYFGVIQSDYLLNSYPVATGFCQSDNPDAFDYFSAALYCLERKNYATARRLAKQAVEIDGDDPDNHWVLGRALLYGAENPEDINQAALSFQEAIQLDPKHSAALRSLVEANLIRGDNAKAIRYADDIVDAYPDQFFAHITRAEFHLQLQAWEEALKDITKAKEFAGTIPTSYLLAGRAYYGMEQYDKGKAEYAKALELHPKSLQGRLGMAQYDVYTGDLSAAVLKYLRLERDFPDAPVVALEMGFCYKQLEQWGKAADAYISAIKRFKKHQFFAPPVVYYDAGQYLINAGRGSEALNVYGEALLQYPQSEYTQMMYSWSGAIFHREGISDGLALGVLKLANEIQQTEQVTDLLNKVKDARIQLEDLDKINRLNYPPRLASMIISNVPLGFPLNDELVGKIVRVLSPEIAQGVLISNKRFPQRQERAEQEDGDRRTVRGPERPEPQPQPQPEPEPEVQPDREPETEGTGGQRQIPAGMAGLWVASKRMPNGMAVEFHLQLNADGSYTQIAYSQGQALQQLSGAWWIEGNKIVYQVQGMQPEAYTFGCNGRVLKVDYGQAGVTVYERRR